MALSPFCIYNTFTFYTHFVIFILSASGRAIETASASMAVSHHGKAFGGNTTGDDMTAASMSCSPLAGIRTLERDTHEWKLVQLPPTHTNTHTNMYSN
jgi:hypothetical protein